MRAVEDLDEVGGTAGAVHDPRPDRDSMSIEELSHVMSVDGLEVEGNDGSPLWCHAVDRESTEPVEPFERVPRQ